MRQKLNHAQGVTIEKKHFPEKNTQNPQNSTKKKGRKKTTQKAKRQEKRIFKGLWIEMGEKDKCVSRRPQNWNLVEKNLF